MSVRASARRGGSALLIVLGFLSFMVVSAVAFAVFMRAERAPSSALRRSVATRHLVKAALARAISAVDDAVRNDLFPGRPGSGNGGQAYRDRFGQGAEMDVWHGRVFMPPDPEGSTQSGDIDTRFAPASETVSVLNLEALGYLPPSLLNDVRFLARCSWSSKWQNLPYDAGRCAYVAVNVSDYFDINRLRAGTIRSSADGSRISLMSLLTSSDGKSIDSNAAKQFDEFVHDSRRTDSAGGKASMPYVSLLDYNLALGDYRANGFGTPGSGGMGYNSPFYTMISDQNNGLVYRTLGLASDAGANAAYASRQTFVTDSWFPTARDADENAESPTNLFFEAAQPFKSQLIKRGVDCTAIEPIGVNTQFKQHFQNGRHYFSLPDWASLYDYLDQDDVPLSLALPSTERIPMVTAFMPNLNNVPMQCSVSEATAQENVTKDGYTQVKTMTCMLKAGTTFPQNLSMNAVVAFPFKRGDQLNGGSGFNAQAMTRLFLVATQAGQIPTLALRSGGLLAGLRPKNEEWEGSSELFKTKRGGSAAVLTYVSRPQKLSYPSSVRDEEQAFMDNGNTVFTMSLATPMQDTEFFKRVERTEMTSSGTPKGPPQVAWEIPAGVVPIGQDGAPIDIAALSDDFKQWQITPCAASWIRIDGDEGVVDYAPAVLNDDQELGGNNNQTLFALGSAVINHGPDSDNGDAGCPAALLPMVGQTAVTIQSLFDKASSSAGTPIDTDAIAPNFKPRSYFAVDPRYNWAPEDWLPRSQSATKDNWLQSLDAVLGQNGCDPDIFMGFSNQGYLQSMGEIAMLPRLTQDDGQPFVIPYDGQPRTEDCEWTRIAHANTAWRTYPADYQVTDDLDKLFPNKEQGADAIIADGSGFRVNPYTDNVRVLSAVLACTPCDWWTAGTTNKFNTSFTAGSGHSKQSATVKEKLLKDKDGTEALKHAFCKNNPEAPLSQETVDQLAQIFLNEFQARPNMTWEQAWDDMWKSAGTDERKLFGVDLKDNVTLHEVDRKFLHAFWRGCFANKQQLFLIFVRAESSALGGPGEGTPSQKGGRAVALVWRDPNTPPAGGGGDPLSQDRQQQYVDDRHPHRTRVLFYHQFD